MPKPATAQKPTQPPAQPPAQPQETIVNLRPQNIQFANLAAEQPEVNVGDRTVRLIASDETPVERFDWENWEPYELIVSHDPKHVDLTRVNNGVAMFFDGHPSWFGGTRLGKIKSAKLNGGRLEVEVKINRSELGDRYLQDVEDGVEPGNSIGLFIRKLEVVSEAEYIEEGRRKVLSKPAVMKAVDWELHELSAVDIPANPNAGSQFSISSQEREQLSKLPTFPVRLSGNPGYLTQPSTGETEMSDQDQQDQSKLIAQLRSELKTAREELADLQQDKQITDDERNYFELRATALSHVAFTNRLTEDDFSADFSGDPKDDLKKLSRLSAEDRRIELKFLARSISRSAEREPIERVEREADRAKLSKSEIESRKGEGNPAKTTEEKPQTPTGESVDDFSQRLISSLGTVRV